VCASGRATPDLRRTQRRALPTTLRSIPGKGVPLQRRYGVPFARRLTGYTPYIEQVDAQRALLGVELSLVQVRTDELTTLVGLYQALGGVPE